MRASAAYISFLGLHLFVSSISGDIGKIRSNDVNYCTKSSKSDPSSACSGKSSEYVLSSDDLELLRKNGLSVKSQACPSDAALTCLSADQQSLIGAGTYGLVVRGRSNLLSFPLAIKFIKLPSKLDIVSFNTVGRYSRVALDSLVENKGSERGLREAVALRLLTEYEIPAVPKYVSYLETASYRILAMEFLDGYEELSKIIDAVPTKDLLVISCQVAAIACNLDQIGVSHDDMHERNILVDRRHDNRAHLIDFGGAHFTGQRGHFTSTSNLLKQPINLLGHLKRAMKDGIVDHIQSQEKKEIGRLCAMMNNIASSKTDEEKEAIPYQYRLLLDKYWKFTRTNKNLFKCTLVK